VFKEKISIHTILRLFFSSSSSSDKIYLMFMSSNKDRRGPRGPKGPSPTKLGFYRTTKRFRICLMFRMQLYKSSMCT